ncbi:MAG: TerC family protein [Thermoleophilia bacterium]|nr:TerC family protein [Thermoleophilia bacterium]
MLPDFGAEFFAALVGIVLADLVLAGDNAVVIALAARNLPGPQRRQAVIFGAAMAIVLRAGLTVAAVFLLRGDLPGVMLVGGVVLLWIGYRLAIEQHDPHDEGGGNLDAASTLRGAIGTIVVADVVMSVDNVLAVAAFAKDDAWLVVFGLALSIPIVMGGAAILLTVIDRFPIIVWVGSVLIVYVAVELILKDPLVHDLLPHALQPTWVHRVLGLIVGVALSTYAWRRRGGDMPVHHEAHEVLEELSEAEHSDPRLMVEGRRTDD